MPTPPPKWTDEEFESDRQVAIEAFRDARAAELLDVYSDAYEEARQAVAELLEQTVDLTMVNSNASAVASSVPMLGAFRYTASPPISEDDLKVLANVVSLAPGPLAQRPDDCLDIVETVLTSLDPNRFPWIRDDRDPTEAEREIAVVSTSSMMAYRRVMTQRANESKDAQEAATKQALRDVGFAEIASRTIATVGDAPAAGQFCGESMFFGRKADIVVTLRDGRFMPIECKVSNSSTNSVKRLNNDAAAKATHWIHESGAAQTVPAAVLAGVFKNHNLAQAQAAGLTIFWAHNLAAMAAFVAAAV